MDRRKALIGAVVGLVVLVGGGYLVYTQFLAGSVQAPEFGVQDMGDWGEVTDEHTEVIHTLWIDNPNPVGVEIGDEVRLDYQVYLNDVRFANGSKEGIDLSTGNDTVKVSSYVDNDNLPAFWVAYLNANETIHYRLESKAHVAAGLSHTQDLPTQTGTALENSTPVITAVDRSVESTEGEYTRSVSADRLPGDRLSGGVLGDDAVTVGYEVRDASAEWGEVTENRTTLLLHFTLHNPSEAVTEPAAPDGLAFTININGNEVFTADGEALSARNVGEEDVLGPGETETYTYAVHMDNRKIDEWFTSHVRNGERSTVETEFQMRFGVGDATIRVPRDSPVTYTCQVQTAILVDGQESESTCGDQESLTGGEGSGETTTATPTTGDGSTTTATTTETTTTSVVTTTTTADATTTTTESAPPTAAASANQTSGEAPLTVAFDASGSSDPDGDITEYVWRFGDGTPPKNGAQVTHTYRTPGTYTAEVTVVDAAGNRATETVEITVETSPVRIRRIADDPVGTVGR